MPFRGEWQSSSIDYHVGDVVVYQSVTYTNIQAHRSQPDWPPSATPALWNREDDRSGGGAPPPQVQPQFQGQSLPPQGQLPQSPPPQAHGGYTAQNGTEISHEDAQKPWYDLDDNKKKELWGGGLALGVAALGGTYYLEHQKHKKEGEEEKQQAWEIQNWIMRARNNTDHFIRYGPRGPVTWIFNDALQTNPRLRESIIKGGEEDGKPWFIARAFHHGSLQPGKWRPDLGAIFGYGHEAIHVKQFEVLIGQHSATRWVRASGKLKPHELGHRPILGGNEQDGTELFIARAEHKGAIIPGKASKWLNGACITIDNKEKEVEHYEVLCYA